MLFSHYFTPALFSKERVNCFLPVGLVPATNTLRRTMGRVGMTGLVLAGILGWGTVEAMAQTFRLPTANQALLERGGGGEKYFVGTTGKPWTSGTFGCVRSGGWQMHEGLDVRCIQRDKKGEPTDPVMATADGTVVYLNKRSSLSNYGNYIVLKHRIEGLDIFSVYAHLSAISSSLRVGQSVKGGEVIGIMGRTSNTHERISKERAHVHFELDLLVSDNYAGWHKKFMKGQRNDHGEWNGRNLLAIDPREILMKQKLFGDKFSLRAWLQSETELCRVFVRQANLSWARRYAGLVQRNPVAEKNGIVGYELSLDFNGVAFRLVPRSAAEVNGRAKFQLIGVNEAEVEKNPARRLVTKKGRSWELTSKGQELLELMTY